MDLQRWCTNRYRTIFEYLEQQRLLDPDDPFHLWALHFCYLPMINGSLIFFANRWNRHRIRTAHHDSPMKIWVRCELVPSPLIALKLTRRRKGSWV